MEIDFTKDPFDYQLYKKYCLFIQQIFLLFLNLPLHIDHEQGLNNEKFTNC